MKIFSFPLSAPIQRNNWLTGGAVIAGLAMPLSGMLALYLGCEIIGLSLVMVGALLLCAFDGTEKSLKTCLKNWIVVPVAATVLSIIIIITIVLTSKSQELEWGALLFFSLVWWPVWMFISILAFGMAWLLDWLNVRFFNGE